jgi:chaperone required for assembly of F1-ATPase
MREIFTDIFENQPIDPTEAARRATRPRLRERFYKEARVDDASGGKAAVSLDGKPVLTPSRRPLAAPSLALGQAIAAEWNAQTELVDPAHMPLTRLANSVIDGVSENSQAVADEVAKYLGTDLLFYRADTPVGLVEKQSRAWDPLLLWARETHGAGFLLAEGVVYRPQPENAVAAMRALIPADNPWRLGAVSSITTLTGSGLIALAVAQGVLGADAAWAAAHVDADWQMSQWGRDEPALERRAYQEAEFIAAVTVLKLAK